MLTEADLRRLLGRVFKEVEKDYKKVYQDNPEWGGSIEDLMIDQLTQLTAEIQQSAYEEGKGETMKKVRESEMLLTRAKHLEEAERFILNAERVLENIDMTGHKSHSYVMAGVDMSRAAAEISLAHSTLALAMEKND